MKLGKLFKAVVTLPVLPVAIVADVMTMGASKVMDKKFLAEKVIDKIADNLDKVTG